jgi:hypothetical protein
MEHVPLAIIVSLISPAAGVFIAILIIVAIFLDSFKDNLSCKILNQYSYDLDEFSVKRSWKLYNDINNR